MRKLLLITLLGLAACKSDSKKDTKSQAASCNMESLHSCREYGKDNLIMGTKRLGELCTAIGTSSTFAEAPCPTAGIIGRCTMPEGTDVFYEGYELGDPEAGCAERHGKFTEK